VEQVVCVCVPPYDGSLQVKSDWIRAVSRRAGHVERGEFPIGTAEEPVVDSVRVIVDPGDHPQIIDRGRGGPSVGARARAGRFKRREFATRTAQKTMVRTVRVLVGPRDRSQCIDPTGVGPVVVPRLCVRTGSIERDNAGLLRADDGTQVQSAEQDI
jgi:hypothetical protein